MDRFGCGVRGTHPCLVLVYYQWGEPSKGEEGANRNMEDGREEDGEQRKQWLESGRKIGRQQGESRAL